MPEINPIPDTLTLPVGATTGARIVLDGTNDRIIVYDDTNTIINIIAASAGSIVGFIGNTVDGPGNYPDGFTVSGKGTETFYGVNLFSGCPDEDLNGYVAVQTQNASTANELIAMAVGGPQMNGSPDAVRISLFSSYKNGPNAASGTLEYWDTSGTEHQVAFWDAQGFHVEETLYGISGTLSIGDNISMASGTSISAGSWEPMTLSSSPHYTTYSGRTLQCKLMPDNTVAVSGQLSIPSSGLSVGETIATVPSSAYYPSRPEGIPAMAINSSNGGQVIYLEMETGGQLQRWSSYDSGMTTLRIYGRYPLDS